MAAKKATRFILRLLLVLTALATLTFVLFRLGIAGRYIVGWVGNYLGLELRAERAYIGLDGLVRLSGFSAGAPDDEPFFTAAEIEVHGDNAAEIVKNRSVAIQKLRLISPSFTLRQDAAGQWNIAPLFDLGSTDGEPLSSLPEIEIVDGQFNYVAADGRALTAADIQFTGAQSTDGRYSFSLSAAGNNQLAGSIDLASLDHEVSFAIGDGAAILGPQAYELPSPMNLRGNWRGRWVSRQPLEVTGDLDIANVQVGEVEAAGQAAITVNETTVSATLAHLSIDARDLLGRAAAVVGVLRVENATIAYDYRENQVSLQDWEMALAGGKTTLNGDFYIDRWLASRGTVNFDNIHAGAISPGIEEDITAQGQITFAPATNSRALEPLAITLDMTLNGDFPDALRLGTITATAYAGENRLITENVAMTMLDGQVKPWLSMTRRDDEIFTHVICDIDNLDLNMMIQALDPQAQPVPGRITGTARVRSFGELSSLSGGADISLSGSDLMNTAIVGTLYNLLNLRVSELAPTGHGRVNLAIYGEDIEIVDFEFFNRGVEILGAGSIRSVLRGKEAQLEGVATGSLQPLRGATLPGSRELDRLMRGLQTGFVSVKVEGTLAEPAPRVAPLSEISTSIRKLILK